jgi:hypothetical protein
LGFVNLNKGEIAMTEDRFLPVSLPSDGRMYTTRIQDIRIRSMCGADEVLLAQMNPMNVERKFLELLRRVLTGLYPEQVTFGDRLYLMLWLSINSYAGEVKITNVCPNCLKEYESDVDLRKINVIHLPENFRSPVSLQLSDGPASVNLLTVGDLAEVEKYSMDHEDSTIYKYSRTLWGPGCETPEQKRARYEGLSTKDTAKIRAVQEQYFHGPDMQAQIQCPHCKEEDTIVVPFRLEFLFPTGQTLRTHFGTGV